MLLCEPHRCLKTVAWHPFLLVLHFDHDELETDISSVVSSSVYQVHLGVFHKYNNLKRKSLWNVIHESVVINFNYQANVG